MEKTIYLYPNSVVYYSAIPYLFRIHDYRKRKDKGRTFDKQSPQ